MNKTANEIQKERIQELEEKAEQLLAQCEVITLASVNEAGFPRICAITKMQSNGFREIYFQTSKRSELNGKATHFEKNSQASVCYWQDGNSVSLIGNVKIIEDIEIKKEFEHYCDLKFFKKGIYDPKYRLLQFTTTEATFWIDGKFRTCKYKTAKK